MSDEFVKVATKEINEEIASIKKILDTCNDDSGIVKNSVSIEKHLHKIKGLAPMMGKSEIGDIAGQTDVLLNHIIDGKKLSDIYSILSESLSFMEESMINTNLDSNKIKQKIETKYAKYLD